MDVRASQGGREAVADEGDAGASHLCVAQEVCCIAVCGTQHGLLAAPIYTQYEAQRKDALTRNCSCF